MRNFVYGLTSFIPAKWYVMMKYYKNFGRLPDLKHPKTFNEKLNWLKLHDRNPRYSSLVDKYEAKNVVGKIIGFEHIIPTLGVWDRAEDIDFDNLPNQFVLKTTHDSGTVIVCKDKRKLDVQSAIKKLRDSLRRDFYLETREWPYKNVKRRIIAEEFMTDGGQDIQDYKIHCFNGTPKVILVCKDRFKGDGLTEDFYNQEWEHLDIKRPKHPNSAGPIARPPELQEMLELSKKLSEGFSFVRTDFYTINHQVYFGELTLYPASGSVAFEPEKWDEIFGDWLGIPAVGG